MPKTNLKDRVEFVMGEDGSLVIRYFDDPGSTSCLNWRLPLVVAEELIKWWKKKGRSKARRYPINKRTEICEFKMYTAKFVEIEQFDELGRAGIVGWSLPAVVVEGLVTWHKDKESKECNG